MIFEKRFLLMAILNVTYMSYKPCKYLKYISATITFSSSHDNALLKHTESHVLFEAFEENDSQVCTGYISQGNIFSSHG
jgi:hypothetical protein